MRFGFNRPPVTVFQYFENWHEDSSPIKRLPNFENWHEDSSPIKRLPIDSYVYSLKFTCVIFSVRIGFLKRHGILKHHRDGHLIDMLDREVLI